MVSVKCDGSFKENIQRKQNICEVLSNVKICIFHTTYSIFTSISFITIFSPAYCNVIEITVFKKKKLKRLYDSKGRVYLRRESSLREITAAESQDWIIQVY